MSGHGLLYATSPSVVWWWNEQLVVRKSTSVDNYLLGSAAPQLWRILRKMLTDSAVKRQGSYYDTSGVTLW